MASPRFAALLALALLAASGCGRRDRDPPPPPPSPRDSVAPLEPPAVAFAESEREAATPAIDGVDAVVRAAIERGDVPGAVVVVLHDGVIVHRRAYGFRAKVPTEEAMTLDTVFDLASLTKPLATATALMVLVEDGTLALSDRAAKWFPSLRTAWGDVTLEELLLHTSGLPPDHAGDEADPIAEIAALTPLAAPGARFLYSDLGYVLLAKIAEKASGRPLHALVQRVFLPLGMRATTFRPDGELRARTAPTTVRAGAMLRGEVHDPRAARMGGVAGHAGLFSTADDLAKYCAMLLALGDASGTRVLAETTVRAMTKPRRVEPKGLRALGWDVDTGYSHPRGDRFPIGGYGHTGFTGTSLWLDPPSKTAIVVLTSRLHPDGKGDPKRLRREIANVVADAVRKPTTKVGLDVLRAHAFAPLAGKRIGLVTHGAAIAADGASALDVLRAAPGVTLAQLFSPEHGLGVDENGKVADRREPRSGLVVHSLYGDHAHPKLADLAGLDALVVDLIDAGVRFFTYETTLAYVLESAAEARLPVFVLDRPNPLGGLAIEGPVLDAGRTSFVGVHPLPIRHGMTLGELARLFVAERKLDVALTVVPIEGWKRSELWDDTRLPWTRPSPNLASATSALLYPGVALLEMTNVSVGRGTEAPFSVVGAPWLDGAKLARALADESLPGVAIERTSFTPTASAFVGRPCGGVRFAITDPRAFQPVRLGFALIRALRAIAPAVWEERGVDVLLGTPAVRAELDRGASLDAIVTAWDADLAAFRERRAPFLLYPLARRQSPTRPLKSRRASSRFASSVVRTDTMHSPSSALGQPCTYDACTMSFVFV